MLFSFDLVFISSVSFVAILLDKLLGEPKRFHPLIGFAKWAQFWQNRFEVNRPEVSSVGSLSRTRYSSLNVFFRGLLCWLLAVLPWCALVAVLVLCFNYLVSSDLALVLNWVLSTLILYLAIGQKSLAEHALAVYHPLVDDDIVSGRYALSMIVSRDTAQLNEQQITTATVETVLENTHDAVIGPLFWFCVLGAPGVVLFRLANTLDAMWGYKNQRYEFFGKTAARMDDTLGFLSARLTVLLFAMQSPKAFYGAWVFGRKWYSPNAGPVMAAGAAVLNLTLGGAAAYGGAQKPRPFLYQGEQPQGTDILRAVKLMYRSSYCWLLILIAISTLVWMRNTSF